MLESVPSGTILNGRYRVERALGSGGFGHVYLATELATGQQYAVKEYLVTGPGGQEQLKHEANVLSQLHHPNLPAFHDAFNERGRYYVVLNYIEGNDLTDIIRTANRRGEAVPLLRIMEWILAICDAVDFLHSQRPSVIHRDIKPDNIRIMPDGTAILVDLGNAKAADGARTLFFIRHQGTPGYAPQEQYPGGSGTDVRSDVYALGGTLFFALTAHEPPSVSARNQAIQQGQPDLPSLQDQLAKNPPETNAQADPARQFRLGVTKPGKPTPRHSRHLAQLGTLPPELLKQLNRIIQKAMAMKPKDRYQSVAELANDLKKVIGALPTPTPPTSSRQLDPHSTQPDLPMLYEAMQAAKGKTDTGIPDIDTTPIPSSTSEQLTNHCPRCNAPLVPQASFCPRCGTRLSDTSSKKPSNFSTNMNASSAVDQTRKVKPEAASSRSIRQPGHKPQPLPYMAPAPSTQRPAPSSASSARGMAQALTQPPASFSQNGSGTGNVSPPLKVSNLPTPPSGFKVRPILLIILTVILLLLLILMIALLSLSGHRVGHSDIQIGFHWYILSTQVSHAL